MRFTTCLFSIAALASSSQAATLRQRQLAINPATEYVTVISVMVPTYSGECNIKQTDDTSIVTCSMPGSKATLTATGINDQKPEKIEVCTLMSGGNSSCKTLYFGSMGLVELLKEAFPDASLHVPDDYETVLADMLLYYHGECSMNRIHGNTDVSCSTMGGDAKFTASGMMNQTPQQVMSCVDATGGDKTCRTYNFNQSMTVAAILKDAFPRT